MAIIAGIDEAGFGPLLGPLVVTGVAFRVPDHHLDRCLWTALRSSCTNRPRRSMRRLAVADSKAVFRAAEGLAQLERTVLVTLAAAGHRPSSWRSLLDVVAPDMSATLDQYPWYAQADLSLPVCPESGDIGTRSNALKHEFKAAQVEFLGAFTEPLDVRAYNRQVAGTRNKAVVLLGLTLRIISRIAKACPRERLRVFVDRQGGRTHYRDPLMTSLSGEAFTIVEETDARSAYRLDWAARACEIDFSVDGDARHFPVALASMYSKYIRELFMRRFNDYWSARVAGLKPTAGYYTDAMRWLADWEAAPEATAVDREALVRSR